jgi:hypothetical protein
MATVRITDDLRRTVRYKLRNIYDARIDRLRIMTEPDNPEQTAQIYNFFTGEYAERMQSLPDGFFAKANEIMFRLDTGDNYVSVKFTTPKSMPYAVDHPLFSEQKWGYNSEYISVRFYPSVDYSNTALEPVRTALAKIQEIHKQRDTAVKQIDMLLAKYATLSPALKEFPALWDLLPDQVRDKHKEVVEKKPKRETVSEPAQDVGDLSSLNAAIIASKLGA